MAIADKRQRIMPMPDDRSDGRSETLGYPEAVRLTDPINAALRGEVTRGLHLNASVFTQNGEYWKKVFGPVFIYLNSASEKSAPMLLWEDAKKQMQVEVEKWPYEFPGSEDFHKNKQRGSVSGRLLVQDKYVAVLCFLLHFSGYQFWVRADVNGNFFVKNVRTGVYNLYAWVPGFIGDYKSSVNITVTS
ncbi:hypothetical protein GW17_00059362, partial [Ensete ventricosum]